MNRSQSGRSRERSLKDVPETVELRDVKYYPMIGRTERGRERNVKFKKHRLQCNLTLYDRKVRN